MDFNEQLRRMIEDESQEMAGRPTLKINWDELPPGAKKEFEQLEEQHALETAEAMARGEPAVEEPPLPDKEKIMDLAMEITINPVHQATLFALGLLLMQARYYWKRLKFVPKQVMSLADVGELSMASALALFFGAVEGGDAQTGTEIDLTLIFHLTMAQIGQQQFERWVPSPGLAATLQNMLRVYMEGGPFDPMLQELAPQVDYDSDEDVPPLIDYNSDDEDENDRVPDDPIQVGVLSTFQLEKGLQVEAAVETDAATWQHPVDELLLRAALVPVLSADQASSAATSRNVAVVPEDQSPSAQVASDQSAHLPDDNQDQNQAETTAHVEDSLISTASMVATEPSNNDATHQIVVAPEALQEESKESRMNKNVAPVSDAQLTPHSPGADVQMSDNAADLEFTKPHRSSANFPNPATSAFPGSLVLMLPKLSDSVDRMPKKITKSSSPGTAVEESSEAQGSFNDIQGLATYASPIQADPTSSGSPLKSLDSQDPLASTSSIQSAPLSTTSQGPSSSESAPATPAPIAATLSQDCSDPIPDAPCLPNTNPTPLAPADSSASQSSVDDSSPASTVVATPSQDLSASIVEAPCSTNSSPAPLLSTSTNDDSPPTDTTGGAPFPIGSPFNPNTIPRPFRRRPGVTPSLCHPHIGDPEKEAVYRKLKELQNEKKAVVSAMSSAEEPKNLRKLAEAHCAAAQVYKDEDLKDLGYIKSMLYDVTKEGTGPQVKFWDACDTGRIYRQYLMVKEGLACGEARDKWSTLQEEDLQGYIYWKKKALEVDAEQIRQLRLGIIKGVRRPRGGVKKIQMEEKTSKDSDDNGVDSEQPCTSAAKPKRTMDGTSSNGQCSGKKRSRKS